MSTNIVNSTNSALSVPALVKNDVNNNTNNDLNNNNTLITEPNEVNVGDSWRNNPAVVSRSVNGTIDLSQYGQNDVDRLYGDALLVYLKNFNETLPARREMISVNGTQSQVPIYRSERRSNVQLTPIFNTPPSNKK